MPIVDTLSGQTRSGDPTVRLLPGWLHTQQTLVQARWNLNTLQYWRFFGLFITTYIRIVYLTIIYT